MFLSFSSLNNIPLCGHSHSSYKRPLKDFHFILCLRTLPCNSLGDICFQSLGHVLGSEIIEASGNSTVYCLRSCRVGFPKQPCHRLALPSHQRCTEVLIPSHTCQLLLLSAWLYNPATLACVKWLLIVALICISPVSCVAK